MSDDEVVASDVPPRYLFSILAHSAWVIDIPVKAARFN